MYPVQQNSTAVIKEVIEDIEDLENDRFTKFVVKVADSGTIKTAMKGLAVLSVYDACDSTYNAFDSAKKGKALDSMNHSAEAVTNGLDAYQLCGGISLDGMENPLGMVSSAILSVQNTKQISKIDQKLQNVNLANEEKQHLEQTRTYHSLQRVGNVLNTASYVLGSVGNPGWSGTICKAASLGTKLYSSRYSRGVDKSDEEKKL